MIDVMTETLLKSVFEQEAQEGFVPSFMYNEVWQLEKLIRYLNANGHQINVKFFSVFDDSEFSLNEHLPMQRYRIELETETA